MSNAIGILEILGRDASLRHAPPGEIRVVLAESGVEPDTQSAILGNDHQRLEALLGARTCIFCGLHREEEEEEEEDEPDKEDEIRHPGASSPAIAA